MELKITIRDYCYLLVTFSVLTESKTLNIKGIHVRIDPGNAYAGQQKHAHVGDFAWHADGTRSHASQWPNHNPTKREKEAAALALKIPVSTLESYMDLPIVVFTIVDNDKIQVLLEGKERATSNAEKLYEYLRARLVS